MNTNSLGIRNLQIFNFMYDNTRRSLGQSSRETGVKRPQADDTHLPTLNLKVQESPFFRKGSVKIFSSDGSVINERFRLLTALGCYNTANRRPSNTPFGP